MSTAGASPWWTGYKVYKSTGNTTPLLEKVANGLNYLTTIGYTKLSEAPITIYQQGTITPVFPVFNYQGIMPVVSYAAFDNGIGGNNYIGYAYEGAKIHRQGKGFLCYSKITVTDATSVLLTETQTGYNSTYYYPQVNTVTKTSIPIAQKATNPITFTVSSGSTLETITNTWAQTVIDATSKRIFPYVQSTTQTNALTGHSITSSTPTFDSYGNPTQMVKNYGNGVTETTVNNYTNTVGSTDWKLGRLDNSTITYAKTGEASVNQTVRFTYSTDGILQPDFIYYCESTPLEYTKNHDYDSKGNLTQLYVNGTSIGASQTNYTYDTNGIRVLTVTDPLGHVTTNTYDSYGRLETEKDYLNNTNTYTYDALARQISVSNTNGSQITMAYVWTGANKPSLAVYGITQTGNNGSVATVWYDEMQRPIRSEKKGFGGQMILTDTEYNALAQTYRVSEPYFENGSALWAETYNYELWMITGITRNTGRNTTYTYPGATVNETTGGKSFSKTYGPDGTLTSATDAGGTISYTYYADGKAKTIAAPGGVVTSMQYDDAARNQTQLVDPSAGTINYTWNSLGQLKTQTDARNRLTTYTYLPDGRPDNVVNPEGTTTYAYNTNKQLTGISSPNSVSRTYGYDTKGRAISVSENIVGSNFPTNFTYDSYGRMSTRTHPSGITETMGYNSYGYLTTISAGGSTRYTITGMNARQQLTAATYGSGATLNASFGFDASGYPTSSQAGTVQDYRYLFNAYTGNLTSRQNFLRSKSESFSYSGATNCLFKVTGPQNLMMIYNTNGNIDTKSDVGTTSFSYGANAGPYALTGVTSNGLIPNDTQTATYTSFEKVSTLSESLYSASIVYNSDNQRAKMDITQSGFNILTRWYAGSRYMKENASGVIKEYTYIGGDAYTAPVAAVTQSGTTTYYYLLRDYLGNITHQVNTSNTVVAEYNFDAWGRRRSADDWSYTLDANDKDLFADRGFTGHEYMKYFNLYNMNGRLYDPLVGRFLSPDPYIQDPSSTQSLNRYSYCLNNPLKYNDPTGMTYFKLNSNWEWESFEYNPFMGGEDNFRTASGGGINPERLNGTYHYNPNTEGYENNIGKRVTWEEVNAKYVVPKSIYSFSGQIAQDLMRYYKRTEAAKSLGVTNWDATLTASLNGGAIAGSEGDKRIFPSFSILWSNYPAPDANGNPAHPSSDSYAKNQCAIRVGVALQLSGVDMSSYPNSNNTSEGYPRSSKGLADWLWQEYGMPTITPQSTFESNYRNKTGIIYIAPPFGGIGHIDLFNKGATRSGYYSGSEIWFWNIK